MGRACPGAQVCPVGQAVRMPLATDRRICVPSGRELPAGVGIRLGGAVDPGLGQMRLRCTLAWSVLPARALGRVRTQGPGRLCNLVAVSPGG
ncbi:MAG TPA: hypothetical protein DCM14_06475 [Clostridiales bacterium UBA8153]|nr:hypothetical protein [Clostridiales bacterium UBA8153]